MSGNLGATTDEIARVSTGCILANVIVLPMTAFQGRLNGGAGALVAGGGGLPAALSASLRLLDRAVQAQAVTMAYTNARILLRKPRRGGAAPAEAH